MRSEGDTWDITTSVGATALFVATARALEAQKPDPLAVDPYAEVFCRAVGGRAADVLDGKLPDHELKTPDWGVHFVNFQAARTKYFDEYFRRAADAGARQVVILAAGLDSRAYRLSWPDGTTIFELDRPEVLDFKRDVLAGHGAQPRAERREVAVDLREDWPQALRDSGFDAAKPSAWIAEGLLIYLPGRRARSSCSPASTRCPAPAATSPSRKAPRSTKTNSRPHADEERAEPGRRAFFQLVYNERHAPATEWFGSRGWTAVGYSVGRLPAPSRPADTRTGLAGRADDRS